MDIAHDLSRAVRSGDADLAKALLERDPALISTPSTRGGTLALEAYEREFEPLAEWLLAERERLEGAYVLDIHEAAAMGRPDALRRAVTQDPLGFEEAGPAGFFPLHRAAYRGHLDVTTLLLEAGADIGARSKNAANMTALHSAVAGVARFGMSESAGQVVDLLLGAGADPDAEMEGGWTAHSAVERDGLDDLKGRLQRA